MCPPRTPIKSQTTKSPLAFKYDSNRKSAFSIMLLQNERPGPMIHSSTSCFCGVNSLCVRVSPPRPASSDRFHHLHLLHHAGLDTRRQRRQLHQGYVALHKAVVIYTHFLSVANVSKSNSPFDYLIT